jgi:transposase
MAMGGSGIGALAVLAYVCTIEGPGPFSRPRAMGGPLGLTPRQLKSREIDHSGRSSKRSNILARTGMYLM